MPRQVVHPPPAIDRVVVRRLRPGNGIQQRPLFRRQVRAGRRRHPLTAGRGLGRLWLRPGNDRDTIDNGKSGHGLVSPDGFERLVESHHGLRLPRR